MRNPITFSHSLPPSSKMVTLLRRTSATTGYSESALEEKEPCGGLTTRLDDSSVKHLRRRWELASVLNFLNVFAPLISDELKLTAEDIEMGLIESNTTNAQLHIALLKGIPPVNKSLDNSDAWITVLCKKLAPWWSWIAKGEIPISANKGEERSEYQGLDPTKRLQFLKALCELRAEQDDARTYIHENVKGEALDSCFHKRKLGEDGKKTSYWFDGSDIQGYRLYSEVNEISNRSRRRKSACLDVSSECFCWETEATNLDEFQRVARELSSNKASSLAAIGKMIETDAIPVVEKYHKKKERALKRKLKQEKVVSVNFSRPMRTTRSCRTRMPVTYTFDEYDKMISEAVEEEEETVPDEEEGTEQQNAYLVSNDRSEEYKMKSTKDETPESDNDGVIKNGKHKV